MSDNIEKQCIDWIEEVFGECASTPSEQAGVFFGLLSTLIWMYAQIPQVIMNFKRKDVEGLSFIFLVCLNLGDTCNLVGSIINNGLVTQFITATWFLIVDISCLLQYIWYNWICPRCFHDKEYAPINDKDSKPSVFPVLIAAASAASKVTAVSTNPYKPPQLYGMILGWISTSCYMSSRMPQIVTNFKRKKTDGLSIQFFWSAIAGNTTYALSIFLKDSSWNYIWSQLPWIMGSAGLLIFDVVVLSQFLIYREKKLTKILDERSATTDGSQITPYMANTMF